MATQTFTTYEDPSTFMPVDLVHNVTLNLVSATDSSGSPYVVYTIGTSDNSEWIDTFQNCINLGGYSGLSFNALFQNTIYIPSDPSEMVYISENAASALLAEIPGSTDDSTCPLIKPLEAKPRKPFSMKWWIVVFMLTRRFIFKIPIFGFLTKPKKRLSKLL